MLGDDLGGVVFICCSSDCKLIFFLELIEK
jgi:hypothetical protein